MYVLIPYGNTTTNAKTSQLSTLDKHTRVTAPCKIRYRSVRNQYQKIPQLIGQFVISSILIYWIFQRCRTQYATIYQAVITTLDTL